MNMTGIIQFFQDDSGAIAAEYVILVSCIATVIVSVVAIFGSSVKELYPQGNGLFNK
jgi:Flp pilus assembly pilin Flp